MECYTYPERHYVSQRFKFTHIEPRILRNSWQARCELKCRQKHVSGWRQCTVTMHDGHEAARFSAKPNLTKSCTAPVDRAPGRGRETLTKPLWRRDWQPLRLTVRTTHDQVQKQCTVPAMAANGSDSVLHFKTYSQGLRHVGWFCRVLVETTAM